MFTPESVAHLHGCLMYEQLSWCITEGSSSGIEFELDFVADSTFNVTVQYAD